MFNRAVSRLSRKRPPSDIHDSDGSSSSSHQTPKSTAKWASSLENLLEDPEGVKRFREFLKKEFSEENVLFWLACEDFKKTQDKKQMQEKAKEIYMTFLSSKASSQVNVEGQSRLNEKILEEPHPLMFQKLQDQLSSPVPPALANSRTFPAVTEALRITYNLKRPNWSQQPNVLFFVREVMAPACAGPDSQVSCSPTRPELQRGRPAEEPAKPPPATSTSCYWPAQDSGQVNFVFGCTPHSIRNLSSPTRDQTHAPCSGSLES